MAILSDSRDLSRVDFFSVVKAHKWYAVMSEATWAPMPLDTEKYHALCVPGPINVYQFESSSLHLPRYHSLLRRTEPHHQIFERETIGNLCECAFGIIPSRDVKNGLTEDALVGAVKNVPPPP